MFKRSDRELIMDMLVSCGRILKYIRGLSYDDFYNNEIVSDAVVRNIEILGEAAKSVSGKIKNKYPEIPWDEIAKTRDKIIHFYFGVDFSIIWDIATIDIPPLEKKLKAILEQENWNQTSI